MARPVAVCDGSKPRCCAPTRRRRLAKLCNSPHGFQISRCRATRTQTQNCADRAIHAGSRAAGRAQRAFAGESDPAGGSRADPKESRMTDRAALAYLTASGATAISILDDGMLKMGKLGQRTVAAWWLPEAAAIPVSRAARKIAGGASDIETMAAALREAAVERGLFGQNSSP